MTRAEFAKTLTRMTLSSMVAIGKICEYAKKEEEQQPIGEKTFFFVIVCSLSSCCSNSGSVAGKPAKDDSPERMQENPVIRIKNRKASYTPSLLMNQQGNEYNQIP